jgi:HEAT repeat protein
LTIALKNNNWRTRLGAAIALGKIGADAKDAVPQLTEVFLNTNEKIRIRYEAMKALENIKSYQATSVLQRYRKLADDISQWVAQHPLSCRQYAIGEVVKKATLEYMKTPPAMCRIRQVRLVLRWKCP